MAAPTDRDGYEHACAKLVHDTTELDEAFAKQGIQECNDKIGEFGLFWDAYSSCQGAFLRATHNIQMVPDEKLRAIAAGCVEINATYLKGTSTSPGLPADGLPTPDDVLKIAGNYCNLYDRDGQIIYTPSLPWALWSGKYDHWMEKMTAAGSTHVMIGPFEGGPAYPGPGDAWINPDLTDPQKLREFILKILHTRSANGRGYVPILFLNGGGAPEQNGRAAALYRPGEVSRKLTKAQQQTVKARIDSQWAQWGEALADLQPYIIVCVAWEPVVGAWSSAFVSYALKLLKRCFPSAVLAHHFSPHRWAASSNPVEPDDPWHGEEAAFWKSHGGEHLGVALYQLGHGHTTYPPVTCSCPDWQRQFGHKDECECNRVEDGVARCGAGYHDWRKLSEGKGVCVMETTAYESYRHEVTSDQARDVATFIRDRVAAKWNVPVTFGNGLPW